MSALNLLRSDLINMKGYTPSGDDLDCRLHANELPWAPLSNEVALNHYPDPRLQQELQEQIAALYQISSEELIITRGSDDALDFLMRLFLIAGQDSFMQFPPTFPMYEFYAKLQQAGVINCPLEADDFSLSLENLYSLWQPKCKLIMLCSPNNPTASMINLETIKTICNQFKDKAIIVVDEAYIEFAKMPSAITLLPSFDNLIVLRTLSKGYGLANLRIGSIIAQPSLIKLMRKALPPYTLSGAVMNLALQALADKTWFSAKIDLILAERERLIAQLKKSPWINKIYPTTTNFILVDSAQAPALAAWFAELGIGVRHFPAGSLKNKLRITVGKANQNQRLLAALANFQP